MKKIIINFILLIIISLLTLIIILSTVGLAISLSPNTHKPLDIVYGFIVTVIYQILAKIINYCFNQTIKKGPKKTPFYVKSN